MLGAEMEANGTGREAVDIGESIVVETASSGKRLDGENKIRDRLCSRDDGAVAAQTVEEIQILDEWHDAEDGGLDEKFQGNNDSSRLADDGEEQRRVDLKRRSSVYEISRTTEQWNAVSSPRRGLDHSVTAPIVTIGASENPPFGSHEISRLSRFKTQVDGRMLDLKLDRLSEREKKKLIENLVKIQKDGTVEVNLTKTTSVASELFELQTVERAPIDFEDDVPKFNKSIPRLRIAMLVVGTRGDVQPFLAIAKRLQEFGHHVRLATHTNFCDFVKSAGVEFYPLGGDPRVLAGYMARNKGFIPSGPGEIYSQRKQLKAIIESLLPACTEPDTETGTPFRAQVIIANPPAYGHAHVAEALGIPLHIFFTMPWTPTYEFPHPLARVPQSAGNWISYILVDLLIWWGIRSYINDFRRRKLKLAPIAYFSMYYGSISHLPTGYMWSPHVVSKPKDWGTLVDVVGYCFLNLGSKYQPCKQFVQWIAKGPRPIYIGFGSMPLDDPRKITSIILEALKNTEQRGILDRGWGDLGIFSEVPDHIFLLDNCPHDWLFPQCCAVVHHGGAGTTATGLKVGVCSLAVSVSIPLFTYISQSYPPVHKGILVGLLE
ncbi:hypothetical protein Dimus_024307 [Dionaea muscipula]